jgi:hypothetical protein
MPEEDAAPHLTPPRGLFSEEKDEPQSATHGVAGEPGPAFRAAPPPAPEEPKPLIARPSEPPAEEPRSRWNEFFGEKAGEDTSMLDSMRSWATGKPQPEADSGHSDEFAAPHPPAPAPAEASASAEPGPGPVDINAIPLRRRSHAEEEPASAPEPGVEPEAPKSRWDEMFNAKAGDGGMLDAYAQAGLGRRSAPRTADAPRPGARAGRARPLPPRSLPLGTVVGPRVRARIPRGAFRGREKERSRRQAVRPEEEGRRSPAIGLSRQLRALLVRIRGPVA